MCFVLGVTMIAGANFVSDLSSNFQGLSKAKLLTAGITLALIGFTLYGLSRRVE